MTKCNLELPLEIDITSALAQPHAYIWIDVRRQDEYDEAHIEGVSLKSLGEPFLTFLEHESDAHGKPYLFICARGVRSLQAAQLARELKNLSAHSLKGGMKVWIERALPIVKQI